MKACLFILAGILFLAPPSSSKINLAFLGVAQEEEPLLTSELERRILVELRSLHEYSLTSPMDVQMLFEQGVLNSPEIGTQRSRKLAKTLNSRVLSFGKLKRMEMDYKRKWYWPWRGERKFRHSMWLKVIDSKSGNVQFSGTISAQVREEDAYLGWEPSLGKVDPIVRDKKLMDLVTELAVQTRKTIVASIRGLEEEKETFKAIYDPSLFKKPKPKKPKEILPFDSDEDTTKSRSSLFKESKFKKTEFKKAPRIDTNLFKVKRPREVNPLFKKDRLDERVITDEELEEQLENDEELLDDVNLLEEQ